MPKPDDAWKSMDIIDHADFEYAPLAALEPRYLSYLRMHSHALDTQVIEPVSEDEEQFDASKYRSYAGSGGRTFYCQHGCRKWVFYCRNVSYRRFY
jgi:hypothetical protein